ncbi:acyl-CoA dehydrogenase family protein [Xenophilus arseniciresistens]|uniref:Acyl-CoA dehydrogenase family protein n=1 Tax=Xenophilus arseniciresistens TaxID=1283306 RepID=A0AAE3NA95_9BURK|nr:acyl-CoA dehydrogenase family protein [Xenophilus arseniciresistens]MDA7418980.1 acyl-CoA dehydrogenase family protein [Xenophilus arseniciresistens]
MIFELDEDQAALTQSLERLLADRYAFEQRRALVASGAAHDERSWALLAELGLMALPVPQAHGGFGGGMRALLPALQSLGRALSLEPYLASAVLAGTALRLGADAQHQAELLPRLADGTLRLAWAHDEPGGRHAPLWVQTRAEQRQGRWVLDGVKSTVLAAGLAQQYVVSARVSGQSDDAEGCALFLVDAAQTGTTLREFRLVDDSAAGELTLEGVSARPLHDPHDGATARRAIAGTVAAGIAAACADMTGAAQAAHALAVDYLGTRRQFGRLIGEYQAMRHRAADMLVALEMCQSMALAAATAADDPEAQDSAFDLHAAKLSVGRNARLVAHGAIQLHGGIGMTEEYAVGHCLRRIHVLDQMFGDADAHAARLAATLC